MNYSQAERLITQLVEINKTLKVIASNQERSVDSKIDGKSINDTIYRQLTNELKDLEQEHPCI
ncbi:hypothetical protein [Levilactobacillus brevis]|uniref:hypothetical protein n=1 Tax=Levilactobacillus brevis TaxID=1580 RepID=UPI0013A5840F|nr:hypothetical protein [Levilactobacillus brevis]NRD29454.1 hypothetical protein [Levilactobacillus brevis]